MRRIISACLSQTIRFDNSHDANPRQDFEMYVKHLEKRRIRFEIVDSTEQADGTLIVKIKKPYNTYSTEGYMQ